MSAGIIPFPGRKPEPDPERSLVEVFRARDQAEALVVQGLLESHGIACALRTTHLAPSAHPFSLGDLGEVRILVSKADELQSRQLLSSHIPDDPVST